MSTTPTPASTETRNRFIYPGMTLPFVLLVSCFAAWGLAGNMTDPLVSVFGSVFSMSAFQSSLVQFAYYGAYFALALPAAFINSKLGYKGGVLVGLALAATGGFLFFPAARVMTYSLFILALFTLASGLSILETSANPYMMAMGPARNATRRLNFAQAFNPIGSNIGVFLAAVFILPYVSPATAEERASMPEAELLATRSSELQAVMGPYLALACLYVALFIGIALAKVPPRKTIVSDARAGIVREKGMLGRLVRNKRYSFGVVAQFFNIAAQTCIWTYTIHYVTNELGESKAVAGHWLQISLLVFLVMRFVMVGIMGRIDSRILMVVMCTLGAILTFTAIVTANVVGAVCLVLLSGCIALLFPTIYGIALTGLGDDTKYGAAGLVMAICGGAIMPLVQGKIIDLTSAAFSYIVVFICFLVIIGYGVYALRTPQPVIEEIPEEEALVRD
ncbi:MAG: L-fucose:H+ symporter permease [Actinomycetaceae bacterium]|nr:L-fucose:H+ symporter permease [Actinomycetaceae bacterium]